MKYSDLLKELTSAGWYKVRQRGSHITMAHPKKSYTITMPYHGAKEIGKGLEQKIRKQAGLK